MLKFQVLTLFPNCIETYVSDGVIHQALKKGIFSLDLLNPRDFSDDVHRSVDDRPFGGGDGMVMRPEVIEKCLDSRRFKEDHIIYLSPQGQRLSEKKVVELSQKKCLTLICGRYGGLDQRTLNHSVHEEISIGDYVLSGGELAALAVLDAVVRKLPGSLGHADSAPQDSFAIEGLEHPLFTRPQVWQGARVPEVLTSGNHQKIQNWKQNMGWLVTLKKRPDLLKLSEKQWSDLRDFYKDLSKEDLLACGVEGLDEHFR